MADDTNNDAQDNQQPPEPSPDLRSLDELVGTWEMSGEKYGRVTFEWMEGGFFLIQHVEVVGRSAAPAPRVSSSAIPPCGVGPSDQLP